MIEGMPVYQEESATRLIYSMAKTWLLAFGLTCTFIGAVMDVPDLLLLQHEHAVTPGIVMRLVPASHGCVEIRYTVGKTEYIETLFPYSDNDTSVGASVPVYYSPNNPRNASTAPPADVLAEESPGWLAVSMFMSIPLTYAIPQLARQLDKLRWKKV
jgi:hypothetical protein